MEKVHGIKKIALLDGPMLIYLKKELKISVYDGIPKVFFSTIAVAILLFLVPKSNPFFILVGVVGSAALFVALLRLTGYITWEDIRMMKTAGRSFKAFKPKRKTD